MANLGRPNLARPRMIQVEGVNKKNIQNLQKGIQQFQANQQKMAQMEEANRIKEAQIYVQSAKKRWMSLIERLWLKTVRWMSIAQHLTLG